MRKKYFVWITIIFHVFIFWNIYSSFGEKQEGAIDQDSTALKVPERIISLSPSITEILYALDLGENVAGVTRYCEYPPEAGEKPKIGGFIDPDYEAILRIGVDLVVLRSDQEEAGKNLQKLGLSVLEVDHGNLAGILNSIGIIGKACGVSLKADNLLQSLQSRMEQVKNKTQNLERPRVLVSIGRTMGSGTLEDVCIAGKEGFYDELIKLAGGVNAYTGTLVKFPVLSPEALVELSPEIIFDLAVGLEESGFNKEEIKRQWNTIPGFVDKKVRIQVLTEGYMVIPGPRFIMILEDMARVIHPELEWKQE